VKFGKSWMKLLDRLMLLAAFVALLPVCVFAPDSAQSAAAGIADIIVTSAPVYEPLAALHGQERYPQGAQLLLLHAGKTQTLVPGFAATADANVSFDGKTVLFTGKHSAGDPWQVWELNLADHSTRKLIGGTEDVIRPHYLPFGRLVYARHTAHGFQLEAAGKDAAEALARIDAHADATVLPLTYIPASAVPVDVLQDGRILFESGFPLGTGSSAELYLVYSDGSGVESYRCDHSAEDAVGRWGGRQLVSGDVVFTKGASLARFTSSLAHETPVVAPKAQYAGAVTETSRGDWLVSVRADQKSHYALKLWNPGTSALQTLLTDSAADLVDPVLIAPRPRPKRHPSGLHDWNYANLLALDSRQSRTGNLTTTPSAVRLETLDDAGHTVVNGKARVEADGSFFVKTPADKPIRFALLDKNGAVLRQEHGWFWIRRGEQRVCVGCHVGPEHSSENRAPDVLLHSTTPTDLSTSYNAGDPQSSRQEKTK
jgi:hypothetical protein